MPDNEKALSQKLNLHIIEIWQSQEKPNNYTPYNLANYEYACTCDEGFTGDGFTCMDSDECEWQPCSSSELKVLILEKVRYI